MDLLLHLVEQAKLKITEISLVQVTGQYLAYMRAEDGIDHRALADFISIGARLIELKSRALLPAPPEPLSVDEQPNADGLVEMLAVYQRFKEVASLLREREEFGVRAFPRLAPPPHLPLPPGLSRVSLDRLTAICAMALARVVSPPEQQEVRRRVVSVQEKIREIELGLRLAGAVSFAALVNPCLSREEIVVAFFAVLELIKRGLIAASQDESFGDIALTSVSEEVRDDGSPRLQSELAGV